LATSAVNSSWAISSKMDCACQRASWSAIRSLPRSVVERSSTPT